MTSDQTESAERDWISPAEASRILGVTPKTLTRWADADRIEAIQPGTHRRYSRASVEALRSGVSA